MLLNSCLIGYIFISIAIDELLMHFLLSYQSFLKKMKKEITLAMILKNP